MNNSQVAHAWANQTKESAKGSNFYFEGPVIYSYGPHFPIAYNDNMQRIFFTIDGYSSTTSKHKSLTWRACSHIPNIDVKFVPSKYNFEHEGSFKNWQYDNISYWVNKLTEAIKEFQAKPRKTSLLDDIRTHSSRLANFLTALNIADNQAANDILNHAIVRILPELLEAKRQKAIDQQKKNDANFEVNQAKRKEKQIKDAEKRISKWRNFESDEIGNHYNTYRHRGGFYLGNTLLRYNSQSNRIETSKGMKIPVQIAAKFWEYILNVLPEGCNGSCNYKIMDFSVKEISFDRVVVGCHDIPMDECNKIAAALGWKVLETA